MLLSKEVLSLAFAIWLLIKHCTSALPEHMLVPTYPRPSIWLWFSLIGNWWLLLSSGRRQIVIQGVLGLAWVGDTTGFAPATVVTHILSGAYTHLPWSFLTVHSITSDWCSLCFTRVLAVMVLYKITEVTDEGSMAPAYPGIPNSERGNRALHSLEPSKWGEKQSTTTTDDSTAQTMVRTDALSFVQWLNIYWAPTM